MACGILGFNDTVSVEQESVSQPERDLANRIVGIRQDSDQEAIAFDGVQPALPQTERGWMAGGGVERGALFHVEPQVGGGNELSPQLTGEDAIQAAQYLARLMSAVHQRLHRHLYHGGDECGPDAMPGDVGHEEAYPVLIDGDEFIEIAGDGGHRKIGGTDAKTLDARDAAGKNGRLYLTCYGKL